MIAEIHDSIDAPVFIWDKVHRTQDLTWLYVTRKKIAKADADRLVKAWDNIYDEYLNEFGISDSFRLILEIKRQIALHRLYQIQDNDRIHETEIEIKEIELSELEKNASKTDIMDVKKAIDRYNKFPLNMKECSIREFYSYAKDLK